MKNAAKRVRILLQGGEAAQGDSALFTALSVLPRPPSPLRFFLLFFLGSCRYAIFVLFRFYTGTHSIRPAHSLVKSERFLVLVFLYVPAFSLVTSYMFFPRAFPMLVVDRPAYWCINLSFVFFVPKKYICTTYVPLEAHPA